jgi:hypothetical protein
MGVSFDILAFALNDTSARIGNEPMEALLNGPREVLATQLADSRVRFLRELVILADKGKATVESASFPSTDDVYQWRDTIHPTLPVVLEVNVAGHLPEGTRTVSVQFPPVLDQVVLIVESPGGEADAEPVESGGFSSQFPISLTASPRAPVELQMAVAEPAQRLDRWRALAEYVEMGFTHILPEGLDHIFFVLGLFLLSTSLRALLYQVTAFTVAHSITLALSLYGVCKLPAGIVEPLIAFSIAFIAVENLLTNKLTVWRPFVVFGFGLVHGLGFAGVLKTIGLPRQDFLLALVGFNGGVELGQISVIALAFVTVGWFRHMPAYRRFVTIPASVVITCVALVWTFTRIAASFQ